MGAPCGNIGKDLTINCSKYYKGSKYWSECILHHSLFWFFVQLSIRINSEKFYQISSKSKHVRSPRITRLLEFGFRANWNGLPVPIQMGSWNTSFSPWLLAYWRWHNLFWDSFLLFQFVKKVGLMNVMQLFPTNVSSIYFFFRRFVDVHILRHPFVFDHLISSQKHACADWGLSQMHSSTKNMKSDTEDIIIIPHCCSSSRSTGYTWTSSTKKNVWDIWGHSGPLMLLLSISLLLAPGCKGPLTVPFMTQQFFMLSLHSTAILAFSQCCLLSFLEAHT